VKRSRLEDLTILEGGMTLEYYPASNCGLIAYFIVRGGDTGEAGTAPERPSSRSTLPPCPRSPTPELCP